MIKIFIFIIVLITGLSAEQIILLKKNGKVDDFKTEVYEDTSAKQSLDDVINLKPFVPLVNRISQGYTKSAFWFRFDVENRSKTPLTYYITVTDTYMDAVDCHLISSDGKRTEFHKGIGYLNRSDTKVERPVFPLTLQAGEAKTVYLRITSKFPMFTSIQLMDETSLTQFLEKINLFHAFYFGALLVLLLYNASIYIFLRETVYLYYILFGSSFLIWQLTSSSFFPFDSFDSGRGYYVAMLSIPLFQAFLVFFSRSILDTKKNLPVIDMYLRFIAYAYILLSVGILIDTHIALQIQNALASVTLPYLFYVGVKSYFKGIKTAIFYLIAQISFLFTGTLFALAAYGILEYSLLTRYSLLIGSFIEMVLFSLALAYKIKLLEQEKLKIFQQVNIELEEKVKERTAELEASKKQFEELAHRDALTNLYNRRFFFEMSETMINAAKREGTPLCVIMFDIDHFKDINDTYGHAVGDHVICMFADELKKLRDSDVVARIGGEEFIVLCKNTDVESVVALANKIRMAVSKFVVHENDRTLGVTVSAGVSCLKLNQDKHISDIVLRADDALYQAKVAGRNKVVLCSK